MKENINDDLKEEATEVDVKELDDVVEDSPKDKEDNDNDTEQKKAKDNEVVAKESKEMVELVVDIKKRSKKFWIISGIIGGSAILILAILILVTMFKADSAIWPSTLSGVARDVMSAPVSDVAICVQGKCVKTDNTGSFSIEKLVYGDYVYTAKKAGFVSISESVRLTKGVNEKLTLQMEQIKVGNIWIPIRFENNVGHNNYNDGFTLKIDEGSDDFSVFPETCLDTNTNNYITCKVTFYNIPIGKHRLELVSDYFASAVSEFEVKHGLTELPEVLMIPAIDISGSVNDGFFGGPLDNAKIKIIAPFQMEVVSDATGKYFVNDIKIPLNTYPKLKLTYEVSKDGYITLQTESEFSVEYNYASYDILIPQGKVITVSNKLGNKNLISTGIDGSGEFTISDNKGDNYNPVLLKDGKTIRFLSTRDGIKSKYGSTIPMVYQIDIDGKNLKKISKTDYFDNDGIGNFNFVSGQRAYSTYEYEGDLGFYALKVGNLEGTELKTIESKKGDGYYGAIIIADNGEYMLYTWKDNSDLSKSGVYRYDFKTDKIDFLYNIKDYNYFEVKTISQDMSKAIVLISTDWGDEGDLWLLTIKDKKMTKITSSTTGEQKPTFFNDDKSILFLSRRDDLLNVYIWDLAKGKETKISNVSGTDQEFYANMCADLVASTKYIPTTKLIDKALAQENAMCPGPYYRYYD